MTGAGLPGGGGGAGGGGAGAGGGGGGGTVTSPICPPTCADAVRVQSKVTKHAATHLARSPFVTASMDGTHVGKRGPLGGPSRISAVPGSASRRPWGEVPESAERGRPDRMTECECYQPHRPN